jgi:low temperature requirement protein LtrA
VTTVELFFDLVFVFTITQLTSVLIGEPSGIGLAKMALLLAIVWWMYGGYAWLTNMVPPVRLLPRLLLVLSMIGFLVVALAVPTAFGSGGVAFGLGYLLVVCVHAGLFLTSVPARRSILRLAPVNIGGAVLLLVAAFLPAPVRWAIWALVPTVHWGLPLLRGSVGYEIRPAHFVERHGLVLIIAFGESVTAIGVGVSVGGTALRLSPGLVLVAALALMVLLGLWWSYFGGADELAEQRLVAADPPTRARMALAAFGRGYYLMLAGVIILAAGVKRSIGHPWETGHLTPAVAIGGGVALYLAGDAALRHVLRLRPMLPRCVGLALAALSIPVGVAAPTSAQLAMLAAVLLGVFAVERWMAPVHSGPASG